MRLLALLTAASVAAMAAAADPPAMFGVTPSRNMVNLIDKNPPTDFDVNTHKNIKWVAQLGSRAYGGPVIYGGKIYVGTNNEFARNQRDTLLRKDGKREPVDKGVLMCFDEATGKFLWQHVNDKLAAGQVNDWPHEGCCSTPAVEGNRLYYVSNRCEVVCLDTDGFADGNQGVTDENYKDPTDADVIWRLDMMKELNVFPHNLAACSPLLVGDHLYIVTANGVDEGHINIPSPDAPSFLCLDKKTGKVVWQSNLPGKHIMHGQWSNPAYGEINGVKQVIFPGGDGWLYGLNPLTGKMLWKFDCNPKGAKYQLGSRGEKSDFIATPVVHDGLVYIGTGQDPEHFTGIGHLWCIDPSKSKGDGTDLTPVNDNFDPKAPVNAKSGLVWHYGGLAANPKKEGRAFYFGRTMSTVSVHGDLCYVAELDGFIHCLDAKTGRLYWKYDLKAGIWGSTYWVGGKIYLATEGDDLYIFNDGKALQEPIKIDLGQAVRSTPVMAHGVLYVMTEGSLFAVEGKTTK